MTRVPREHWADIADFYMAFRDGMIKFAARLLGSERHLAHDVVQETFQAAALQWTVLRDNDDSRKRAWLYRVLKNKIFDHWGGARRRADTPDCYDPAADLDTPRVAVSNVLLEKCWKAIDGMPFAQRRVALLKWQGEWTNREIGDHLEIAQPTVRVHLRNARRDLVEALGAEVVYPSEWRDEIAGEEAAG
ncbi:RNA polymerase sigma factor [Streptomyces chartreusis]